MYYVHTIIGPEAVQRKTLDRLNYARTIKSDRGSGRQGLPAGEERVVRYGRERNQVTRRRIIETAGRRFKADGINASNRTSRAPSHCSTPEVSDRGGLAAGVTIR